MKKEYPKGVNLNSIEDAAKKYSKKYKNTIIYPSTVEDAFIVGANSKEAKEYWQQNMSSYDDVSHAIRYAIEQSKLGLSHEQILIEYNKVHRKPYNSETEELHTKNMYSEEEVLYLFAKYELDNNKYYPESLKFKDIDEAKRFVLKWFKQNSK